LRRGENYLMRNLIISSPHEIFSGDQIENNVMGGACSTYGEKRGAYRVLVGKTEGKRQIGRPWHRWSIIPY
jgi:hypothetical protein